ncbi:lipocalin family protein [Sulfitobacter sp. TSTF-M16]|uniref:Lipocalin family protein n=1 Tax=Sulfitobacter aestuariivivens TaxID=2766981 RepID=A0A927CZX7_9RHOB|nr:lipocalin family protein [Sulfitobacter aestuariivivens]
MTSVSRRYYVGIFLILALAACDARRDTAQSGASYRDQDVLIGVTSRYDEARFLGQWYMRAALPANERIERVRFENRATGLQMQMAQYGCDPGGTCGTISDTLKVEREGVGRYAIDMADGTTRTLWVLWVDESFRTALVGNPEGAFAWILDRQPTGGADRIAAAREILDFNGYDVSQLRMNE